MERKNADLAWKPRAEAVSNRHEAETRRRPRRWDSSRGECTMADRPQSDPPTDNLTTLGRPTAVRRCAGPSPLRPRLQPGVTLNEVAKAANIPVHKDGKGAMQAPRLQPGRTGHRPLPVADPHRAAEPRPDEDLARDPPYAYVEEFSRQRWRDGGRCRLP